VPGPKQKRTVFSVQGRMSIIVQKFGGAALRMRRRSTAPPGGRSKAKLDGHQVVMVVSAMARRRTSSSPWPTRSIQPPKREMDMLLTTGEQVSISLMAMALEAAGHKAISFTGRQVGMVTDASHTKARIRSIDADRIYKELNAGKIVIVAGFQGVTRTGH